MEAKTPFDVFNELKKNNEKNEFIKINELDSDSDVNSVHNESDKEGDDIKMNIVKHVKEINTNWKDILFELIKEHEDVINEFLNKQIETYHPHIHIFPPRELIFNAFNYFDFNDTRVVILGQDPYINENEAMGLSFSVPYDTKIPPSLRNIHKELESDIGCEQPLHGNLLKWARQGVLLLNSALTVRQSKSNSHSKIWKDFTDSIIKYISDNLDDVVFILWGRFAESKKELIDNNKHNIIVSSHPSPFSCKKGFFGSKPFSRCNEFLKTKNEKSIIDWNLI